MLFFSFPPILLHVRNIHHILKQAKFKKAHERRQKQSLYYISNFINVSAQNIILRLVKSDEFSSKYSIRKGQGES